ncbi:MAG: type II toxin-antitoxin system VapC family toxin [Bifidobacteriaceae bacterium]|jgi:predicted nucleic acid-binding protein|nr:type II toxin-antitoxin system VapC family toxin [Bifidobacteriaceae bacterium]
MAVVLDTSMTMAWCFEDEATVESDRVLSLVAAEGAVVPALWRYEVANVFVIAERRERITRAKAAAMNQLLDDLPISLAPSEPTREETMAAARDSGLTAYDATYLLLAQRLGLPLASLDAPLCRAAAATGVALVSQP